MADFLRRNGFYLGAIMFAGIAILGFADPAGVFAQADNFGEEAGGTWGWIVGLIGTVNAFGMTIAGLPWLSGFKTHITAVMSVLAGVATAITSAAEAGASDLEIGVKVLVVLISGLFPVLMSLRRGVKKVEIAAGATS